MKTKLILILLLVGSSLFAQKYPNGQKYSVEYRKFKESKEYVYTKNFNTWDWLHTLGRKKTVTAIGLAALSGVIWGHREIYHAYPNLLQDYYNQADRSFIGEDAWMRNYVDWNPNKPHKIEMFNSFRDIHHLTGFSFNLCVSLEHPLVWGQQVPRKYKYLNTVVLSLTRSLFAGLTYKYYVDNRKE